MKTKANGDLKNEQNSSSVFDLGDCVFNAEHGELYSKLTDEHLHIEKKVAQVFECLAKAKGEVVTREEIFDLVWPHMIVSDDSLNRCISVLRKNLKHFGHKLTIKTHPKFGFNLDSPCFHCQKCVIESDSPNVRNNLGTTEAKTKLSLTPSINSFRKLSRNTSSMMFIIVMIILLYWLFPSSRIQTQLSPISAQTSILDPTKVAIVPFQLDHTLLNKYPKLETIFRNLMMDHPSHSVVPSDDMDNIKTVSSYTIGQQFNARFVIRAQGESINNRDILNWQLIDAQTRKELLNDQINLALNSDEINSEELVSKFVYINASVRFDKDTDAKMNYLLESAKYLFNKQTIQAFQQPVITMLARAITEVDPESSAALALLAQQLLTVSSHYNKLRQPYINLSINLLQQAIRNAPLVPQNYQSLADLYLLNYQWGKAKEILTQGENLLAKNKVVAQLTFDNLTKRTGHFYAQRGLSLIEEYNKSPLSHENIINLVAWHLETNQIEQAIALAETISVSTGNKVDIGALIGPSYLRVGNNEKGKELTMIGYQTLGVAPSYSDVLMQGIIHSEYQQQASDFLTNAENNQEFSETVLLLMYAELADMDNYFRLAFKLAKSYDFDVLSTLRANTALIRQHQNFLALMHAIGLHQYWQSYGEPDFCYKNKPNKC